MENEGGRNGLRQSGGDGQIELATSAVVITPSAASGAIVGPVRTASALLMLLASSIASMASEMRRFPLASFLAKSSRTWLGLKWKQCFHHVEDVSGGKKSS